MLPRFSNSSHPDFPNIPNVTQSSVSSAAAAGLREEGKVEANKVTRDMGLYVI